MPLWEVPRRVCESDCTSCAASRSLFLKTSIFLRKDAVVFLQQAQGFEEAVQTVSSKELLNFNYGKVYFSQEGSKIKRSLHLSP